MSKFPRNKPMVATLKDEFDQARLLSNDLMPLWENVENDRPSYILCHEFVNIFASVRSKIEVGHTPERILATCDESIEEFANPEETIKKYDLEPVFTKQFNALQQSYLDVLRAVKRKVTENIELLEFHPDVSQP